MEKNNSTFAALMRFTQRYIDTWQQKFNHAAMSKELYDLPSPCITNKDQDVVFWLPVLKNTHSLSIIEEVVNLKIHPDIHFFYCSQYAGDMAAQFNDLNLSLIQVWSEDDFKRLEQNIIAHLNMQRRLKRRPSIFIATSSDETNIISIDNQTGAVMLEKLIENKTELLADNLALFLTHLKAIAQ